jgi:hypothetical protein
MQDYRDIINEGERLLNDATGRIWLYTPTGGGCDSFVYELPYNDDTAPEVDGYYQLTYDANIPTNDDEWHSFTLVRFDGDGSDGVTVEGVSTIAGIVKHFYRIDRRWAKYLASRKGGK